MNKPDNHSYPINNRLQKLLDAARTAQAPQAPADPQPWYFSPVAALCSPVLAVTTSSDIERKD